MPLVSIREQLSKARAARYAVPCFETFEMMGALGIVAALEAKRAPGIFGVYSGLLDRPDGQPLAALVRAIGQASSAPLSLILDHGASFEHCVKALSYGFTDVMFDGSRLDLDDNIRTTRLIVRTAHAMGAAVEAELGHVGAGNEYQQFGALGKGFTDPAAVERFVAETEVDALAVAVGTAHGAYEGAPRLDLDLLDEIARRVDIPLVLHGGSGLSDAQFQSAIARGISKINIFTNLAIHAATDARAALGPQGELASAGPFIDLIAAISGGYQRECERCLDVFGATGRA